MANTIYKHGTYREYGESISTAPENAATVPVYIGTAPINLIAGYNKLGLVNKPIVVKSYADALAKFGYSTDWVTFTLCEAIKAHFNNRFGNVAPVVFINVLDPATHVAEDVVTENITFKNGSASIYSDKIIVDTLSLTDLTLGEDYEVSYNFTAKKLTIKSIGEAPITGMVAATYSVVDTSDVAAETIIGEATADGVYSGIGAIDLIYQTYNLVPSIIAAPGWSEIPEVYNAMLAKAEKINGHWDAFTVADIPLVNAEGGKVDTIALAKAWQTANGYTDANSKVCFPQAQGADGEIYHLSTLTAWRMVMTDNTHDGIPMESPSNKALPVVKQYFGAGSTNAGFDQQRGNELNEAGITTVVYWGGEWVLWGAHTAAFVHGSTEDAKNIFDNNVRMMMYVANSFQSEHALTIDAPMTRAMADTIKNREQQKADALVAIGALIGAPVVEFRESDNSTADLVNGDFTWAFKGTPTPPFKSGTLRVTYTDEGFSTFYEEV